MLESTIQSRLKSKLEREGLRVIRNVSRSKSGYPDLDVSCRPRLMTYVEVKQPGEKLTPLQEVRKKELEDMGFPVIVAFDYSDETVNEIKNSFK